MNWLKWSTPSCLKLKIKRTNHKRLADSDWTTGSQSKMTSHPGCPITKHLTFWKLPGGSLPHLVHSDISESLEKATGDDDSVIRSVEADLMDAISIRPQETLPLHVQHQSVRHRAVAHKNTHVGAIHVGSVDFGPSCPVQQPGRQEKVSPGTRNTEALFPCVFSRYRHGNRTPARKNSFSEKRHHRRAPHPATGSTAMPLGRYTPLTSTAASDPS